MLLIVPTFNNPTYVRNFVNQVKLLDKFDLMIVDNNSNFPEMMELLHQLENEQIKIIKLNNNYGPRWIYEDSSFFNSLPQKFCVSDPDIQFNPKLPSDFLDIMFEIGDVFRMGKVGFAIENCLNSITKDLIKVGQVTTSIFDYESQFWDKSRMIQQATFPVDLYLSPIDTTFACHNKTWFQAKLSQDAIRVAGDYVCKHLPWTNNIVLPENEKYSYKKFSKHSYFSGSRSDDGEPFMYMSFTNYLDLINEIGKLRSKKLLRYNPKRIFSKWR
jgi:hypothetical protein